MMMALQLQLRRRGRRIWSLRERGLIFISFSDLSYPADFHSFCCKLPLSALRTAGPSFSSLCRTQPVHRNIDPTRKGSLKEPQKGHQVLCKEGELVNQCFDDEHGHDDEDGDSLLLAARKLDDIERIRPDARRPRGRPRRRSQTDALSELQQKVDLLQSEQVSASEVSILLKKKAFKSASPEQLVAILKVLKEFCAPSGETACQVLAKNSGIIWQPIDILRLRLKVLADFEVGEEARLRLASSMSMLTVKVEKLQETLQFLKDIGLPQESIDKIICKNPKILRLSVQSSLQPTVDFLQSTGMSDTKILKLLERRPELFAMSIDNDLMVKYKFFQQLGLSGQKFSAALRSMTQYSNDTILARLNAIKEHGFSDSDVLEMVRKQPNILANSIESIENKLNYLIHEKKRAITEVVRFPACLGYSLEQRIIPRFKFLEENGLSQPYSLSTILATTKLNFVEKCKKIKNSLVPTSADPSRKWGFRKSDLFKCAVKNSSSYFLSSCKLDLHYWFQQSF